MIILNPQGFAEFASLKKFPNLIHKITTVKFGDQKFSKKLEVNPNFMRTLKMINKDFKFTLFQQVHGPEIAAVDKKSVGRVLANYDGGITGIKNLFLAVFVADCFPILAYDPENQIIGIAHAGWKGIKAQIAKNLILKMKSVGATPKDIIIGIGPGICGNCYEVQNVVTSKFRFVKKIDGKFFLDLEKEILAQLKNSRVKKANIETAGVCVFEDRNFYSYRRDQTNSRQAALIGLR